MNYMLRVTLATGLVFIFTWIIQLWMIVPLALSILLSIIIYGVTFYAVSPNNEKNEQAAHYRSNMWAIGSSITKILSIFWIITNTNAPLEPIVLGAYNTFTSFSGLLIVLLLPVLCVFVLANNIQLSALFRTIINSIFLCSAIRWLISNSGEELYAWAQNKPHEAMATLFLVVLLYIGLRPILTFLDSYNKVSPDSYCSNPAGYNGGVLTAPGSQATSELDEHVIVAHESGHAMMYACLASVPKTMVVRVNSHRTQSHTLGSVSYQQSKHFVTSTLYAEWNMLMTLAGKASEIYCLGYTTLGSTRDHKCWHAAAHEYLSAHTRGIYYESPRTKLEQEYNVEKLNALYLEQMLLLQEFLKTNVHVLDELRKNLAEFKKLNSEDMAPILKKVIILPGMPNNIEH